jgi:hypothetical protein
VTTAVRISHFLTDRYPPVSSGGYAVAFAAGGIGLFAALAGERVPAGAIPLIGAVAVTLFADLLIMRVLDDIRDQDYDRAADPQRAFASGAVSIHDLGAAVVACLVVIVVANLFFPAGMAVIAAQLGYVAVLMAVGQRFPATRGDNLVLNVLLGLPVQLLLYVYLLVAFAHIRPDAPLIMVGTLGVLILTLCAGQIEFGKKLVRRPSSGERSYTRSIGYLATFLLTTGTGPLAAALFAVTAHASPLSKMLVALPATAVAGFGLRHVSRGENRWPATVSTFGLWGMLVAFAAAGAIG